MIALILHESFIFIIKMKSNSAPSQRALVHIDPSKASYLKERVKKFDEQFSLQQSKFQSEKEQLYYIVSTVYLKQWRQFASSNQAQRLLPIPMNEDLLVQNQNNIRPGLLQGSDFQLVNSKIYQLIVLSQEPKNQLKRYAYFEGKQKKVTIYLSSFNYLKLTVKDLKAINNNAKDSNDFTFQKINIPEKITVQDLLQKILKRQGISSFSYKTRLWKIASDLDLQKLYNFIKQKCKPIPYNYVIEGPGKLIDDMNAQISDLNMQPGQYFIIEIYDSLSSYFFRSNEEGRCEGCYKYKKLPFPCGCKKVAYCTQFCQEKDKKFHMRDCTYAQEQQLNQKIDMNFTKRSAKGLVGLSNLGNTCFMNSCLQSLSHTMPLTQYFLLNAYQAQINKQNVLGTKGKLAKAYAKFIKNMWCGQQSTFSPYSLKSAVSSVNQMFAGYAQHDSQQFFSFLVDGIHQDLSRVLKKPYVQSVQSKGRKDDQVAKQSWIAHTMRNQSIITDLMTGQYKSKVVCPDCDRESITFDPFTTVSLPLPEQSTPGVLKYYVIFKDTQQKTKKMSFQYKKANTKQWHQQAVKLIKRQPHEFLFYVLTIYQQIYSFNKTAKTEIINKIQVEGKNAFLIELSPQQQNIKNRLDLCTRFSKKTYYGNQYDNVWFKRPFFFQKQGLTGKEIAVRVLKFLYWSAYNYSKRNASMFGSKSIKDYLQKMLQDRPFMMVLRSKKKVERQYNRWQTSFKDETQIKDDTNVSQILKKMKQNDYQLDIRFTKNGYSQFDFEKLKDFDDCVQRHTKKRTEDITLNIQQCFTVFQEKQTLDPGNEWYCPQCKEHKLATKQMFIYKAPEILILHLKRFKNKGIIRKEKNQANVIYPHVLDISKYVIDPTPMSTYIPLLKKQNKYLNPSIQLSFNDNSPPIYELYAISNHYGGLGGGHYTAYAKNGQKWYQFNDSSVRSVSQNSMSGSGAYMLFYRRRGGAKVNS